MVSLRLALLTFCCGSVALSQPLLPPPQPPGNPVTTAKANLGKVLFWDEQLSSTRTVACGTCHIFAKGGTDGRSIPNSALANHPGPDNILGNDDDVYGSPGVPLNLSDGTYSFAPTFKLKEQVTSRTAPTAINAAYGNLLFWDGRATGTFTDPTTNTVVLQNGGALESQILGPPLSSTEMAHVGRVWNDVVAQLASAKPLVLSPSIPSTLSSWINDRSYPQLFAEAFGTSDITPVRIAFAIASYERTLISNQTPFDTVLAGTNTLTSQEQQGLNLFRSPRTNCAACHTGPVTSDFVARYTGVRPVNDDLGRFTITGNPNDRGAMQTPTLRNVELKTSFMHNGRFATLEEVVDFYNRGGDFNAPNRDPRIRPLGLNPLERAALVAFLKRPLTDPRVRNESAPFDRPLLFTESSRVPQLVGATINGTAGISPKAVAFEPPLAGSPNFTVGVYDALGGAQATLVIDTIDHGAGASIPTSAFFAHSVIQLAGSGSGGGYGSVTLGVPSGQLLIGKTLYGRWYINDAGATGGVAVTQAFRFAVFGTSSTPLPVQLVSFAGRFVNNAVRLTWTTISETNNFGFYVQRKRPNEVVWTELANSFVAGNGTTNQRHDYLFTDNTATQGSWSYRLRQVDLDGGSHFVEPIQVSVLTEVTESAPTQFALLQNYPNPFNPTTTIRFNVPIDGFVSLKVYNMLGQEVASLVNEVRLVGSHSVVFDASDLSSGIYLYKLTMGNQSATKKLTLLR